MKKARGYSWYSGEGEYPSQLLLQQYSSLCIIQLTEKHFGENHFGKMLFSKRSTYEYGIQRKTKRA